VILKPQNESDHSRLARPSGHPMIPRYRLASATSLGLLLHRRPYLLHVVNDLGATLGIVTVLRGIGDRVVLEVRVSDGQKLPSRLDLPDGAIVPPPI
jgi:hypothetical protein